MNILVVTQYFWPENFRINDLVKYWVKSGHHVTVLTGIPNYPSGKIFDDFQNQPSAFSQYEGAKVVRVPMLPRGSGGFQLILNYLSFVFGASIWGSWRLRRLEADVIFVFEPSPVTVGLPAIWLSKIKKIPVVFWALDLWPETLVAIGVVRSPLLLGWISKLVKFIYNRCTLVLVQSRGFLENISSYCSDKTKIRYFPNWAESVYTDLNIKLAPEVPVLPNSFTVVFAGNIGEAQDMPALLDAAELLKDNPNIRWIVVGDGRKFEWLKSEVSRRRLQESVLLKGRFPLERMPSFYSHADALLVSLKQELVFTMTIPGKLQSYLLSGIPLLGMLDGEGAEIIRKSKSGLTCDAGNSMGLAKAVLTLASMSSKKRRQLGLNGRLYAQKEYGRIKLMKRLDMLLTEAVTISKFKSWETKK